MSAVIKKRVTERNVVHTHWFTLEVGETTLAGCRYDLYLPTGGIRSCLDMLVRKTPGTIWGQNRPGPGYISAQQDCAK